MYAHFVLIEREDHWDLNSLQSFVQQGTQVLSDGTENKRREHIMLVHTYHYMYTTSIL